tara:strand:+ start:10571 stop:10846 length:276 start_codon:yes stop_codon:yes gene_type:complete
MIYHFIGCLLFLSVLLGFVYIFVKKLRKEKRAVAYLKGKIAQEEDYSECLKRENWRLKSNFEIGLQEYRSLTVKYNMLEKSLPIKNKKVKN